jgi:pSer/pThr/pTyr-binding forkhead associated (FHA) protein
MKNLLFVIFFQCISLLGFSQTPKISFKNINTSKWPTIEGKLWVRNPEGIKNKEVYFVENGKKIKISVPSNFEKSDSVVSNKALVFILLHNPNDPNQLLWHKNVLKTAIDKADIKKGDQVTVFYFNNQRNNRFLFPESWKFSDDKEVIKKMVDDINPGKNDYANSSSYECSKMERHLIRHAAREAMELLASKTTNKLARGVFIMADDKVCSVVAEEEPQVVAEKNNLATYAITYNRPGRLDFIEGLCERTYGKYYRNEKLALDSSAVKLIEFINDFSKRHAGVEYKVSYDSQIENKDGSSKTVKIECEELKSDFTLIIPKKSLLENIKANILWILLVVIFLVLSIYLFQKNNKKKQAEIDRVKRENEVAIQELERKRQFDEEESRRRESENQKRIQQQINEQERNRMQDEQRRKQEEEALKRKSADDANREMLIAQMREKGNFPWIEFTGPNGSGRYEIHVPETIFGRERTQVDFALEHPTVSKKHFVIYFKDYKYFLRDLDSTNGTFLNSYQIKEAQLNHGDLINVGEVIVNFYI